MPEPIDDGIPALRPHDPRVAELLAIFLPRILPETEPRPFHFMQARHPDLRHVVDWIRADVARDAPWLRRCDAEGRPVKLTKIRTLEAAVKEADKAMRRAADALRASGVPIATPEPVYETLDDGWTIVRLTTAEALDRETAMMGHCVGNGAYDDAVDGRMLLSLRDPSGRAHATMEVQDGRILQLKGKQNRAPLAEYVDRLVGAVEREGWLLDERPFSTGLVQAVSGRLHRLDAIPEGAVLRSLDLAHAEVDRLPRGLVVMGRFGMTNSTLRVLPEDLTVHGDMDVAGHVETLPGGLVVEGQLTICFTRITALPEDLKVGGRIATNGTRIPVFVQTVRDDQGYIVLPGPDPAPDPRI